MTMRPFENEVGVCAKRSLRSLLETHPSCPDLIRASINLREKFFEEDGSPGHQARRRAEPVIGPRFARTRWRCAEHDRQLGGESPLSSLMVAKD
jgi:hypothetical protein